MRLRAIILLAAAALLYFRGQSPARDLAEGLSTLSTEVRSGSRALKRGIEEGAAARVAWRMSGPGVNLRFDPGVPEKIRLQFSADLGFIARIKGSGASDLHGKIFGRVHGLSYADFFGSRIKAVGLHSCGSPSATACVISRFPNKMWLTSNYRKFDRPQILRMMVAFHEARHTEAEHRNWPHARCPVPFLDGDGKEVRGRVTGISLAGKPACDVTPLGAYGSSMIMVKNISRFCSNCTDKVMMDAGLYADDQLKRIIDPEAKRSILDDLYR
ncbi:MAG: hypothetical protein ABII00_00955 [Elusimicrobiota bacterium]